jgi:hypothetical protein
VPVICVCLQQPIRLFKSKQIQHKSSQTAAFSDLVVQNARVGRREHAICCICEIGNHVDHSVAQAFEAEAVREDVDVQERVVGGFAVFVRRGEGGGVEPGD